MATYDMFLFHGHGEGDVGACGNGYTELERAKLLTSKVYKLLVDKNVSVLTNLQTGYNNYNRNLTKGHTFNYKMGCTIHLNSSVNNSAKGMEIIVPCKEKCLSIEEKIMKNVCAIGFQNRGLKSRDYSSEKWIIRSNGTICNYTNYYKEIRESWNNGNSLSILEMCFISNVDDITLFNVNIDRIAKIIANAYLEEMGKPPYPLTTSTTSTTNTTTENVMYRVVTGSFKDKSNAEKRVQELKNKGFDSFIEVKK